MECVSYVSIQRRRICCTVIWIGDAQSTYLLNLFIFVNGDRLSQVPACRFSTFFKPNHCTVFAIWLSCITTGKSFEHGRWKFSFAQFLTSNHPTIPVRFNWGVFWTCDAFHINNSINYFWASVWLMPDPSRCYEPFGESLSRLTVDSKSMSEFTLLN